MKEIKLFVGQLSLYIHSGVKFAIATVVNVDGSAYRRPGARMLINENGDWAFQGYISNYVVEPVNRQSIGGGTRNKLTISISVAFENAKNKDENFERVFTRFKDFEASSDFSSIESSLVDDITDILVQDVFNETALKW